MYNAQKKNKASWNNVYAKNKRRHSIFVLLFYANKVTRFIPFSHSEEFACALI